MNPWDDGEWKCQSNIVCVRESQNVTWDDGEWKCQSNM